MNMSSLQDLFLHELQDMYNAENQIIQALPKMADAASADELKQAFREHLDQTKSQKQRLEQIFDKLGQKPGGIQCEGMQGILKEGNAVISADAPAEVKDAALIAAAQRVEHYEMAGYGSVRNYALRLGHDDTAQILQQILDEEGATDHKLTDLAEREINPRTKEM